MPQSPDNPTHRPNVPNWMPYLSKEALMWAGASAIFVAATGGVVGYKMGQLRGSNEGYKKGFASSEQMHRVSRPDVGINDWVTGCPPGLWKVPPTYNYQLNPEDSRANLYRGSAQRDIVVTPESQARMTAVLSETLKNQEAFLNGQLPDLLSSVDRFRPRVTGWSDELSISARGLSYENNGKVCVPNGGESPIVRYYEEKGYSNHQPVVDVLEFRLGPDGIQLTPGENRFAEAQLADLAQKYLRPEIRWQKDSTGMLRGQFDEEVDVQGVPTTRRSTHRLTGSGFYQQEREYIYR